MGSAFKARAKHSMIEKVQPLINWLKLYQIADLRAKRWCDMAGMKLLLELRTCFSSQFVKNLKNISVNVKYPKIETVLLFLVFLSYLLHVFILTDNIMYRRVVRSFLDFALTLQRDHTTSTCVNNALIILCYDGIIY